MKNNKRYVRKETYYLQFYVMTIIFDKTVDPFHNCPFDLHNRNTHTQTHTQCTHIHTLTHVHTNTHTHKQTHTHKHTHTHSHIHTHTLTHTRTHKHTHSYTHIRTHTYYTYIHTH